MAHYDWSFADDASLGTLFRSGVPRCYHCNADAPDGVPEPHQRCVQCQFLLHTCPNCMFYNGIACLIQDPGFWAEGAVIGQYCASFNWRQQAPSGGSGATATP